MCGCANIDGSSLGRCKAIAELWRRAGLGSIEYLGGGRFRWGCVWYGLPAPVVWAWPVVRWVVASNIAATGEQIGVDDLPRRIDFNVGCGCIAWLKDLATGRLA